jgi:hypothetical protein
MSEWITKFPLSGSFSDLEFDEACCLGYLGETLGGRIEKKKVHDGISQTVMNGGPKNRLD